VVDWRRRFGEQRRSREAVRANHGPRARDCPSHLLLQTGTQVLTGDLDQLILRRYPGFRKTPASETALVF
jgi:hypothetical protein